MMEHLEKRFGSKTTVGELRSVLVGQLALYERRQINVSELADQSGQPLSSVSRRLRNVPWIRMVRHPADARAKYIEVDDVERMVAWVIPLAHRYKDYRQDRPGDQLPLCDCAEGVEDRSGACNVYTG